MMTVGTNILNVINYKLPIITLTQNDSNVNKLTNNFSGEWLDERFTEQRMANRTKKSNFSC